MSSNNNSTNPPPSTAGETLTTRDNDPSPSATEPTLPPPAGIELELSPGGNEAPTTPAQIGADQDRVDAATKESMEHIERDEDAPAPPVQAAAEHEEMESTIKKLVQQREDVPVTPSQIAAGFENIDRAIKETSKDAGMVPPLPPPQMATLAEEMEDYDKEYDSKKRAAPTTEAEDDIPPPSLSAVLPVDEQEETLQRAQDPPTPAVARAPSPPPTNRGRSLSNPGGQQQLPIRPPPPSMMPSPDDDADPPVPALPRDPSMTPLVATLVEDRQEALVVPDLPIYDAVQVPEQTWMKKYKKYIFGGLGLLIGTAATAGVAVSSNNGSSEKNATVIERVVLSTARPSESSPPSDGPSVYTRPSQISSHRPSSMPTPAPPLYCGEINILTDRYPGETSWQIRTTVTLNGIPYPNKIVLQGAPEEEGCYTYKACLERGDYEFAIIDRDGIYSPGYYNVTFEGIMIAQGGEFASEERVPFSLPSWSRQDLDFNGDASYDEFGQAVAFSADASTMAIGAPGRLDGDRPGYVKVYRRAVDESRWEQRGDTLRGEVNGDYFGRSLALSEDGTTLSIGAPLHDSVGPESGQVKVYEWDEAALDYLEIGDTLYGAASGDYFGCSLDISSGKILAVGAGFSDANGSDSGQVTIYAWDDASSNFKQRGEAIDGDAAGNWFGISVSLTGNGQKLAVGAPNNDSNGSAAGQVRTFEWDESTSNYEQLGDSLLGDAAGDEFGQSVSFSRDGTTLAIAAPFNSRNSQYSGQVQVVAWDEAAANFEQIGQSLFGKAASDYFGSSVALSSEGKTLAVGTSQDLGRGYVEVYGWDEVASEYKQLGQKFGGEASGDGFGKALALAGNGRDLAVGASENDRNGTDSGRVEVFHIEL